MKQVLGLEIQDFETAFGFTEKEVFYALGKGDRARQNPPLWVCIYGKRSFSWRIRVF